LSGSPEAVTPGPPDEPEGIFREDVLADAVGPSLPAGVIEAQDSEGRWWRYPLREFTE
jgi:hypothetical protein